MTDATMSDMADQPPLGVGNLISQSFGTFFKKLPTILILGAIPALIGLLLKGGITGFNSSMVATDQLILEGRWMAFAATVVIDIVAYSLLTAMIVLLTYDAKTGKSRSIGGYIAPAVSVLLPLVIMSIVMSLILVVAFMLLIIPGIWMYGVLAVVVPAIVIEKAGFGALGRSAALTKEYRWPVVGVLVVIGIIVAVISGSVGAVAAIPATMGLGLVGMFVAVTVLNGLAYGMSSVTAALVYARLREIKEGAQVEDLAAVFD